MKLLEAISSVDNLPDEAFLFVERINGRFCPESRAVFLELSEEELEMNTFKVAERRAPGTEYFLEAYIIRDMSTEFFQSFPKNSVGLAKFADILIQYAENDA